MLCVVYVLRRGGEKLPSDVVKRRPHVGWLYFGDDSRKVHRQEALRLFQAQKVLIDVVEPLIYPRLQRIDKGGMLFVGNEEVRSSTTQKQAWWVLPGPLDDLASPP